ncbi:MAG: FHA domain-containing protein [Alphaproteobacteria bacterium]|nr:FHA domain-containing protein [Alphaproteobacteria bacterium]
MKMALCLLTLAALPGQPAHAADELRATCALSGNALGCGVRPPGATAIKEVAARVGDRSLPVTFTPFDSKTAVFFLVDVSDPARKSTVARNRQVIDGLIALTGDKHQFGIARFAAELSVLAELGSSKEGLLQATAKLQAEGVATEFTRSALALLQKIEGFEAARKVLVVFSDGKFEDTAYPLDEVIARAKSTGTIIVAFGYAEKPSETPALQNLRRLADETGGLFLGADTGSKDLPPDNAASFFATLGNGGALSADLSGLFGQQTVTLSMTLADGRRLERDEIVGLPGMPAGQRFREWVDANRAIAGGGTAALVLLCGGAFIAVRRRREAEKPAVQAWLAFLDGQASRHPVTTTALSIGRNPDNGLCLANETVSGHHAEIHRQRDGTFAITDLGSVNGVYVNEQRVERHELADGDLIELGEVRLRFESA